MDSEFSKYMISSKDLKQLIILGSNHPRRLGLENTSNEEYLKIPKLIPFNQWKLFNKNLNIIFGDSHGEFLGRLFFDPVEKMGLDRSVNRTYCFWTKATTLIGAVQSKSYFGNVLRSLTMIIEVLRQKISFNKVNIIISLGEIDVRTKVYQQSYYEKESFETIISKTCGIRLSGKMSSMKKALQSLFEPVDIEVYFKKPPPPAASLKYVVPETYNEMLEILKKTDFPTFLHLDQRVEIQKLLVKYIKKACTDAGVKFLDTLYSESDVQNENMSFDGVHISGGDWALQNCKQIFYEI